MARSTLTLETDGPRDAFADLVRAFDRLGARHGAEFRALDRRLHEIFSGKTPVSPPEIHYLGEGVFTYSLPRQLTECLAEARRLGVLEP